MENKNPADFEKGFENGIISIDKENYANFLAEDVNFLHLSKQKNELEKSISEIKLNIEIQRKELLNFSSEKHQIYVEYGEQLHQKQQIEENIETRKEKIATYEAERKSDFTPYPFLAGFIYLLAGLTFIFGDLIISHEIVAYALNIRNKFEGWAFAVGLAGVSILLKPAYDRLIEQPYLKNETKNARKYHGIFQGFLIFIALGTLGVLGFFRYESYKIAELKKGLNQEIKALQQQSTPLITGQAIQVDPALNAQIEAKLKTYNELNVELVNSPWAMLSFVLSGVLFAIAGAICLGIAFPSLTVYWRRWFHFNINIWRNKRKIRLLIKKENKFLKSYFKNKAKVDFITEQTLILPQISELEISKINLEENLKAVIKELRVSLEKARQNFYSDGYDTGNTNAKNMTDEELEEFRKLLLEKLKYGRPEAEGSRAYRSNGLRPHQALRKAISENFRGN